MKNKGIVCKETFEILMNSGEDVINRIPLKIINGLKMNMDKSYEFSIDKTKWLFEQNVCKETKLLLSSLYIEYISDEDEKERLKEKISEINNVKENMKIGFDEELIFGKQEELDEVEDKNINISLIEVKEENIIQKLFNKILRLFKKNKQL